MSPKDIAVPMRSRLSESRPDSFDLVITDLTMPHMTGIDLAREILKIRPDTPIILCTGFSDAVDENRSQASGDQEDSS